MNAGDALLLAGVLALAVLRCGARDRGGECCWCGAAGPLTDVAPYGGGNPRTGRLCAACKHTHDHGELTG